VCPSAQRSCNHLPAARTAGDAKLRATALAVIADNYDAGVDPDPAYGGGLLYFRDVEGFSPPQLEWSAKLWWPACEAMIAFAMAYEETLECVAWAQGSWAVRREWG
jgi:N-acylglucosamine 2-epimerase